MPTNFRTGVCELGIIFGCFLVVLVVLTLFLLTFPVLFPFFGIFPGTRGVGTRDEGRFVRTVYNGSAIDMPCSARGDEFCTLATFRTMMERYRVVDYEKECRIDSVDVVSMPGLNASTSSNKIVETETSSSQLSSA